MKVLYVSGIVPEAPAPLRPLPPLDSGAPHGNIMRLLTAVRDRRSSWALEVVSAAAKEQLYDVKSEMALYPRGANLNFNLVLVPRAIRRLSGLLWRRLPVSRAALARMTGTQSLLSFFYVLGVRKLFRRIDPDLVVLDDGPQFIRPLLRFVPGSRLVFYCRGDMGESRAWLHRVGLVLATNPPLGSWVRSINARVGRIGVIPNSLPGAFLEVPAAALATRRERLVLYVGRLARVKGVHTLIRAFARVHAQAPGSRLMIVGAAQPGAVQQHDSDSYVNELRELAAALLPPQAVVWTGWLSGEELVRLYRTAALAVFPSECIEGFGMVALEAMACGAPVIASRRPGFEYLLGDGRGLLVDDPRNVEALAAAMLDLLENRDKARDMAQRAFRFAREFTPQRAADSFVAALEDHLPYVNGVA